jgi:LCP family protein required for cell wall assembly
MRATWLPRRASRAWVEPVVWAGAPVLYVVLVAWLSLHGFLDVAVLLVVVAILGLAGLAVWRWRLGHRRWSAVLVLTAVVVAATSGWYAYALNAKIADIPRADDGILDTNADLRPEPKPTKAVNILLMGADNAERLVDKPTVAELLADGDWDAGTYNSDTMMVVHIPANRRAAYVVSVPRDSYVPIYDAEGVEHGSDKINAAFRDYGPFGALRTVEQLSGVRIDHMAVIDYAGFNELTRAIGGVDVYVPETFEDTQQKVAWEQGWNHLEGERALQYVRTRHGLEGGDFQRIDRQQNFLRAVLRKTLADGTIGNPVKLSEVLSAVKHHLTVDRSWSTGALRSLAFSMRGIDAGKVRFMTLPLGEFQTLPDAGAVNIIDEAAAKQLWKAVLDDKVGPYLKAHPDDELPDEKQVD